MSRARASARRRRLGWHQKYPPPLRAIAIYVRSILTSNHRVLGLSSLGIAGNIMEMINAMARLKRHIKCIIVYYIAGAVTVAVGVGRCRSAVAREACKCRSRSFFFTCR